VLLFAKVFEEMITYFLAERNIYLYLYPLSELMSQYS
jgi:hypothetical protein